jgi:3-dehydroquinate synthase
VSDLRVRLRPGYPVRFRESFGELWAAFRDDHGGRRCFFVVDQRLLRKNPRALNALPVAQRRDLLALNGGEGCKSMAGFQKLQGAALAARLDRQTLVVAVGGGTVGDLTGFFAATHLRGLDWCCVATTSLAMADSAVGGKTGLNLGGVKNVVGAFHQPRAVYGCAEALDTLPRRHRTAGLAEVVKSAMIADAKLFARLEAQAEEFARPRAAVWIPALRAACRVKADIVARDETEHGPRALLNFGHTLAHALESSAAPRPLHGEAVALGMIAATQLSIDARLTQSTTLQRLRDLLRRLRLPHELPELEFESLWRAMSYDKTRRGGRLEVVLTPGIGSASFGHPLGRATMRKALRALVPLEDRP